MATENPYNNPTEGKEGFTVEILESLTDEELQEYINYLEWEQTHREDRGSSAYQSRAYYQYRSNNWIQWCQEIIQERKKK